MKKEFVDYFNGLRGLAILFVIFFHMQFIKAGFIGVDIFFVLSGYLITKSINNKIKKETSVLHHSI